MNFNKIKLVCDEKGLTIPVLADKIGLSEAGLYQSFRNQSMKVDVLEKISEVLETPIWVFFDLDPLSPMESLKKEMTEQIGKNAALEATITNLKNELQHISKLNSFLERINQDQGVMIDQLRKMHEYSQEMMATKEQTFKSEKELKLLQDVLQKKIKVNSPEFIEYMKLNPEFFKSKGESKKDSK